MFLKTLNDLVNIACNKGIMKLVVAVAQDDDVLKAVKYARQAHIIEPTLIGDKSEIKASADLAELDLSEIEIIHETDQSVACNKAVKLVRSEKTAILMKGLVSSSTLFKAILNKDFGLLKGTLLSHIALFESPYYYKIFCVTDAALNVAPDINEKKDIIINAVTAFHKLGNPLPKVGVLAAVEIVNPKIEATIHASLLKEMYRNKQINGCIIDGPFALDIAISREAAEHKGIVSEVAGDADIMLAPDLNSGNILYKSLNFLGGAISAAIVLGATAPVVLTSRADSDKSKFLSIALASVMK
jgi:phosphate butyryltransferase